VKQIVVNDVYIPHLDNMARTQIFYGGSGSGKSVFLAQRVVLDVLRGGRNYLVCRAVGRTLRKSVMNEIKKAISSAGLTNSFATNKNDGIITCKLNGYQILFTGLDDTEKIKSITPEKGVITDIWIEEATEANANDIKDLNKRLRGGDEETDKRMTLSFNPILKSHWIFETYFQPIGWADEQTEYNSPELSILKTWYIHNKFLTLKDIQDLLSEKDEYYRLVYTFGGWGTLAGVIFTNWVVADLNDPESQYYLPVEQRTNRRHGLDFGFSEHPAAVGNSHYDNKRKVIYIYREMYETGLTNDVLASRVIEMIGKEVIVCDSAEPKSIVELQNHGVSAVGAKKGKDSITFGIDWLKQQSIVVDKTCVNMQSELSQYHWKKDANGHDLNPPLPVDRNNHLIDQLRYAYEGDMIEQWQTIG
jgi:phage terminase large subunit